MTPGSERIRWAVPKMKHSRSPAITGSHQSDTGTVRDVCAEELLEPLLEEQIADLRGIRLLSMGRHHTDCSQTQDAGSHCGRDYTKSFVHLSVSPY